MFGVEFFHIDSGYVGRPSPFTVPEVTVWSVAPIFVGFAIAVFLVKGAVNPSEVTGGS